MARRRFTVRDIAEILEHWQAGRSIKAISRSLGVARATVRKYVYATEARGYHRGDPTLPQGWKAFLREVVPRPLDPSTRSKVFAILYPLPSFYRYVSCYFPDVLRRPRITTRRDDPPPSEEAQIDFGYLGMWQDPQTGRRYRSFGFCSGTFL